MAEALDQVKKHFGRQAVILRTRSVPRGGLWGVGGKEFIEITAARNMAEVPRKPRISSNSRNDAAKGVIGGTTPDRESERPAPWANDLVLEIGSLKGMLADLVRETRRGQAPELPKPLFEAYSTLIQNSVADELARQMIENVRKTLTTEECGDNQAVRQRLASLLESSLPTAGPVQLRHRGMPTIVALVGPTGVGKTTTIAKLAANFRLREQRRVGLITIDTYRIAAVAQLKIYADIIDVPLEVVMTPDQLSEAVARMADREVILIDTAGRSQRDAVKITELQQFFSAVKPHEVHLVLSGTASERVLAETAESFQGVGIDRIIFTKLDEAVGFGVILNCLQRVKARLSYVTTGQDVPDDIAVAEGKAIARMVVMPEGERVADSVSRRFERDRP